MGYGLISTIACPRWCGYAAPSSILDAFALTSYFRQAVLGRTLR